MKAPERMCPRHQIKSTDKVGVNSNKRDVYRCVGIGVVPHHPHYFILEEMKVRG